MIKNLENKESIYILENNYIGHLAYIFQNKPFIVPITYYYDQGSNVIICYSGEGHKISAMRKNNAVSLQVAEITSVNNWKSVLVHGEFEQHFGSEAKAYLHAFSLGIKAIITEKEQKKLNFISEFSSEIHKEDTPVVFLIKIEEITGKKRNLK
jgi:nitroimidazol reductase NimA-like FMN-containing flavoprotein (pyridoxamine 5'-phosphate oxidase superfamily)